MSRTINEQFEDSQVFRYRIKEMEERYGDPKEEKKARITSFWSQHVKLPA